MTMTHRNGSAGLLRGFPDFTQVNGDLARTESETAEYLKGLRGGGERDSALPQPAPVQTVMDCTRGNALGETACQKGETSALKKTSSTPNDGLNPWEKAVQILGGNQDPACGVSTMEQRTTSQTPESADELFSSASRRMARTAASLTFAQARLTLQKAGVLTTSLSETPFKEE